MTTADWQTLPHALLCTVEFYAGAGTMHPIGDTPFHTRRVGYITGGKIEGERLRGEVLPGGGNWPIAAKLADGTAITTFDARTVWKTHDDALIYVTHTGRMVVPPEAAADFADPDKAAAMDPSRYAACITPLFETADPRYDWLNAAVTIGIGRRIKGGIRYSVFKVG